MRRNKIIRQKKFSLQAMNVRKGVCAWLVFLLCCHPMLMGWAEEMPECTVEIAVVPINEVAAEEETGFPLAPVCFEGEPDYRYFDDHLAVQIQAHYEGELAYFLCDIQAKTAGVLKAALSGEEKGGTYEAASTLARRQEAVLAFNGDDYGTHKYGVIIRNGKLLRAGKTTRHMLTLDQNGDLAVTTDRGNEKPKAMGERLLREGVLQTWEFGPELVRNGEAVSLKTGFDLISVKDSTLEPRTAIGQIGPLHYVVLVVDGRRPGYSDGISLSGLQQMLLDAGAQTAFNLDGGGSVTLVFQGEVINRPSGGKERSVSDILYFQ